MGSMTPQPTHMQLEGTSTSGIGMDSIANHERKWSKSSVGTSIRSDDQSIPSPPLSPYQSNVEFIPALSTSTTATSASSQLFKKIEFNAENRIDTIIILNSNNDTNLKEFPVNNHESLTLNVNAWSQVNKNPRLFKRNQLKFLKSYSQVKNSHSSAVSKAPYRKYTARRHNVSNYNNSDSETNGGSSSAFEKVRTRRLVRESSQKPGSSNNNSAVSDDNDSVMSAGLVSTPRKRKPHTGGSSSPVSQQQQFIDWESVPDYCPDLSTLPNNNRCLKVEWKGQPMSLVNDPLYDKLHPAEVLLASILRLPCNLYLDSKRRLFQEKVARLRKNLPFRRTDAQKSCRIDVNKASRLFASFEKIGWLDDSLFEKYL